MNTPERTRTTQRVRAQCGTRPEVHRRLSPQAYDCITTASVKVVRHTVMDSMPPNRCPYPHKLSLFHHTRVFPDKCRGPAEYIVHKRLR